MHGFADYAPGRASARIGVTVVPASPGDTDALVRIQERADRSQAAARQALGNPSRRVLVARTTGTDGADLVVGWAVTHHHARPCDVAPVGCYLGGITVDPAWRRRGVGDALTEARIDWVAERSDEVFYVVNPQNRASIALHDRWGFAEVACAPRLAGISFEGGRGLLMRAVLGRPPRTSPVG